MYGEDCLEWNPQRWIVDESVKDGPDGKQAYKTEKQRVMAMERGLLSWSYSNRVCLGKPLAEMEALIAIIRLLEEFEFEWVWDEKFEKQPWYIMKRHYGMMVNLKLRQKVE